MRHPLRRAENSATVNVFTGGCFAFGIAHDYRAGEVKTLGAPM